eukprot:scaffold12514_cov17-Tisochrysis_lutea.AAC.1
MAPGGPQGPATPLHDEAEELGSVSSSRRGEGFFQMLASDDERIAEQQRTYEDIPPPPPLPAPEPHSSSRGSVKPRLIPAELAQAALERSKPRSGPRGRARSGTGRLQKWPQEEGRDKNGYYRRRGVDYRDREEGEEPTDPEELRA